jgi:RNA polymerase sigma factor for flagellar operon FliA
LNVVIVNIFRDFRIQRWGKWRPSAQARRLAATAVLLETLIYRDGHEFESACHVVEQRNAGTSRDELRRIRKELPYRMKRRVESAKGLETIPSADDANGRVLEAERDVALAEAERAVHAALERLDDEDRLIVKMLYFEGLSVADVARALHVEQKPLYQRVKRLLGTLKEMLEKDGVSPEFREVLHA